MGSMVISCDPGTRNLGICLLEFMEQGVPLVTMEDFLNHIALRRLSFVDLGTAHVNSACVRFKAACCVGGELAWIKETYEKEGAERVSVVVEQQGSPFSPITNLCHFLHGFFLGLQTSNGGDRGTVYVDFPAASKFRGDWTRVQPRGGVRFDFGGRLDVGDPVKQASVEACERVMTYFRRSAAFQAMLDKVVAERRVHDMCDCILQGVSYLFRRHIQKQGSTTQRAQPSLTLPLNNEADETTEELLKQPRKGRKRAGGKQTTAVRSKAAKRRETVLEQPEEPLPQLPGDDIAW